MTAPADPDAERWMQMFGVMSQPLPDGRTQILIAGPCSNYDPEPKQHCRDYDGRPQKCREFLCADAREDAA
jgi:Fe-S-cluster containining protein